MESNNTPETVISSDAEIVGTMKTSGSVQFDGKLEGDLQCGGSTAIGKTATIKGNLEVDSISIAGSIVGNVTANDRIEMLSTARVNGDIKAKRLTVEDGVTFIGRSEVNPSGQAIERETPSTARSSGSYSPSSSSSSSSSSSNSGVPPKQADLGGEGKPSSIPKK